MRILFMGTPLIAANSLQHLIDEKKHDICAVFTRQDKPVGRKKILTAPPVKIIAQKYNLNVFQPRTLKDEQIFDIIQNLNPDIIVVVAYGRILPKNILDIPKHGAVNLHVSLLPKYRGAAPVQWAIINGENKTGVTIMQLDEGLDTGDIIDCLPVDINENENSQDLMEKVSAQGAIFLCDTLDKIQSDNITKIKQNNENASHAPPLTKEMAQFNFNEDAKKLHNLIRGMYPWPIAFFELDGKKIKVSKSELYFNADNNTSVKQGELINLKPLTIACKNGALILHEIIPEGSKPMSGTAYAMGKRLNIGDVILN